jgi:hypothetical protein
MNKFTLLFFSVVSVLLAFPVWAQTVVTENEITRQPEYTPPTDNWVGYSRNAGTLVFVKGPGVPAPGNGSLRFTTPAGTDKAYLYNYDHIGTALSDITGLAYSTYRTAGGLDQLPSIHLEIDYNGAAPGGFAVLIFEPAYNPDQGTVTNNTWQAWNAINGGNAIWWSSMPINGVCDFTCYVTWNYILANNPQAVILGGFGVSQGSGTPGSINAVNTLTIAKSGTTMVYDFEATPSSPNYSNDPSPLPVTWLYFKGQATESGNQLNWATATEKNCSHFVIEHSLDGRSFEAIGEVEATGNSSRQLEYTFLDKNATVFSGKTVYYRLKQMDLDESFVYSSVIGITREVIKTEEHSAYPNPFGLDLTLEFPLLKESEKAKVELTTLAGKIAYRKEVFLNAGSRKFELKELQDLPAGLYLLHLALNDKLTVLKVLKQ